MSRERRFIRSIQAQAKGAAVLCADIGSAQTRISLEGKIVFDQPTCLALRRDTGSVVAIGHKAYQLLGKSSTQVSVLFPVQHGAVASTHYFKLFLQAVKRELTMTQTIWSFLAGNKVMAAIPDSFSPVERETFLQSLAQAGFGKVIPVSLAQAVLAGVDRRSEASGTTCVITIGGQTSEIALISGGEEVVNSSKYDVGGIGFTEAVQERIRKNEQCLVSWHVAELVKKEIGCVLSPVLARSHKQKKISVQGKDIANHLGKTIVVSAEAIMPAFDGLMADTLLHIQLFFSQIPTELVTSALSSGLVLSGGTALMPGLADLLSSELHCEVTVSDSPANDVVNGLSALTKA